LSMKRSSRRLSEAMMTYRLRNGAQET
jgi:hypothetical protein